MDLHSRIVRNERALTSPIEDELLMFDAEAGKYYGLNEVATAIWNHLEQEQTVARLIDRLTDEFDISTEECQKEVMAFLPRLIEKDLINIR